MTRHHRRMFCAAMLAAALGVPALSSAGASNAANALTCEIFAPRSEGTLSICSGPFPGTDEGITITLSGLTPNRVREIRLAVEDSPQPFQRIRVDVRPVIDIETVGILFMDMNFDGYSDLAVMKSLREGYRYFLFQPAAGKFAASDELDKVAWPEFDPETRTVRSYWQRADGSSGHDHLVWNSGRLEPVGKP